MRRKTIQLAKNTLVLSLPSVWTKRNAVKKGDELDIECEGNRIVITSGGGCAQKEVSVDSAGLNERTLRWIFSSLHKQGFDEIKVRYDDPKVAKLSEEIVKDLFVGFAIVSQKDKTLLIKQVARDSPDEFDIVMRRAFLVTVSLAEGLADAVARKDIEEIKSLIHLEKTNNQLTNFCMRLVNQGKAAQDFPTFYYVILWNLEKIADEYKYISRKVDGKAFSEASIKGAVDVAGLVRRYYTMFYDGDAKMLSALADERDVVERFLEDSMRTAKGFDKDIVFHLQNVVLRLADFGASFIAVKKCFVDAPR